MGGNGSGQPSRQRGWQRGWQHSEAHADPSAPGLICADNVVHNHWATVGRVSARLPPGGRPGLRGNRNWLLLWLGQSVSITGDYVFDTTVVLWIATVIAKGQPWAPAAVGGVLIAAAVPALLVGPFAGVYVDRWDRHRTMLVADACRAALACSRSPPRVSTCRRWPRSGSSTR